MNAKKCKQLRRMFPQWRERTYRIANPTGIRYARKAPGQTHYGTLEVAPNVQGRYGYRVAKQGAK